MTTQDGLLVTLTDIAHTGRAVGRDDNGRAIFAAYALPGDQARVRVTRHEKRYALARLESVITPAPERIAPLCPHFGVCGGCHWQMADYAAQLAYKQQIVRDQLARGGLPDVVVHPTIPSSSPYHYRTHVTFHVTKQGRLGYVADDDRTILPIDVCHIMRPSLAALFDSVRDHDFSGIERARLQVGSDDGDRLIALTPIKRGAPVRLPDADATISLLDADTPRALRGSGSVLYTVRGKDFQTTGGSFFQVNLDQAAVLVDLVMASVVDPIEHALDLYSGVGLFTAFLADHAAHVTAIESFAPAVFDAAHNLADHSNVRLITGMIEDRLNHITAPVDLIVLDPPRAGVDAAALDALIKCGAQCVIYVSCDASTLARDAKKLTVSGYNLMSVQPVDMFPQTFHVETVAVFDKS